MPNKSEASTPAHPVPRGDCDGGNEGYIPLVSHLPKVCVLGRLPSIQEHSLWLPGQFDFEREIRRTMACQARRTRSSSGASSSSLSSLTASICSSSLSSLTASICSSSSLTSLSYSSDAHAAAVEDEAVPNVRLEPSIETNCSQDEAPPTLGKRRRKRNPKKEAQRLAKRAKANPRQSRHSVRQNRQKFQQAMGQAVQSDLQIDELLPSRKVKPEPKVFELEALKARNFTVLSWDGV